MEVLRVIPGKDIRNIHEFIEHSCPMTPGYIPAMITSGIYVVTDSFGKRLPPEQALKLLE